MKLSATLWPSGFAKKKVLKGFRKAGENPGPRSVLGMASKLGFSEQNGAEPDPSDCGSISGPVLRLSSINKQAPVSVDKQVAGFSTLFHRVFLWAYFGNTQFPTSNRKCSNYLLLGWAFFFGRGGVCGSLLSRRGFASLLLALAMGYRTHSRPPDMRKNSEWFRERLTSCVWKSALLQFWGLGFTMLELFPYNCLERPRL